MKKQVKLDKLPAFINGLLKKGHTITRVVKNGNSGGNYVLVEWEPQIIYRESDDRSVKIWSKSNIDLTGII